MDFVSNRRLVIFTRYPELGKAKTRLIPAVGAAIATQIHRRLTEYTLQECRNLSLEQAGQVSRQITVCFAGGNEQLMADWLGPDLDYLPQGSGDLGEKIVGAIRQLWQPELGHKNHLLILGIDCPELNTVAMQRAFHVLEEQDIVLGEAADGGYYLIGLKQIIPQLFQGIPWSTATVFQATVMIAEKLGLKVGYLPVLRDIDRPEDLTYLAKLSELSEFSGLSEFSAFANLADIAALGSTSANK
jgi:rSAM/selenodomain-associated transferase 1